MQFSRDAALKILESLEQKKPLTHDCTGPVESLEQLYDHLFLMNASRDPHMLSQLGLFESLEIRGKNTYLNDYSPATLQQDLAQKKESLRLLQSLADTQRSPEQRLAYNLFLWSLLHAHHGETFLLHEYKINQLDGALEGLIHVFTELHPLQLPEEQEAYVQRLQNVPLYLERILQYVQAQQQATIHPPTFTIEQVITIIDNLLPSSPQEHLFYKNFIKKTEAHVTNAALPPQILTTITEAIYPALRKVQQHFKTLLATATTNHGVWALPNGDAFYAYMLKYHTTTDFTPEEVHVLGKQEVLNIQQQMRTILASLGIVDDQKPVGVLLQQINQDPQQFYPNTAAGREQCIQDYRAIIERSRSQLEHLFDLQPSAGVIVKAVPEYQQETAPAAYYLTPTLDGSRPGIFFANLRNMAEVPKYSMETLTIHEAEPGHHFQLALQQELNLPLVRKTMCHTAYAEGWALYAEKLAYEAGFYTSEQSILGHLRDELLRAVRLVVDTGIHYKRWTREQAIEYMHHETGMHYDSVVSEVERYFVLPGQACAYKIGQLKILELRNKAKVALDKKFDIKEFHNIILGVGSVPLVILEQAVINWIEKKALYGKIEA